MRGLLNSAQSVFHNFSSDIGKAIDKHWSNNIGGSMSGFYLLVPFTRLSIWVEWRDVDVDVGFGHETGPDQWEFFAGRLQGVFCIERAAGRSQP